MSILNQDFNLAFICSTCRHWKDAVIMDHRDTDGEVTCMMSNTCHGPLSGGDFCAYDGPICGYMDKFCHVCGTESTMSIVPKGKYHRIGVCDTCMENLRRLAPAIPGRKILFKRTKNLSGQEENPYEEIRR